MEFTGWVLLIGTILNVLLYLLSMWNVLRMTDLITELDKRGYYDEDPFEDDYEKW